MAPQGELFPEPEVTISPDTSRGEPRLWVRRLVIWEKPGEIIREIRLRRGLNIIWSPDPGAGLADLGSDAGSGHGAGKTLFCRLLRYCLGEDSFSNNELRKHIADLLPAGLVGAEVVVDGKPWAVIRPIGQTRKLVVREGVSLEEIASMKEPGSSIEPFLDELVARLFPTEIEEYLPGEHKHSAWLFALAWLSRDQECRFDHILDWRHKRADSGSVALGATRDQLLVVVRAFLGIIEQKEMRLKSERTKLSERKRELERDVTFFQRQSDELKADLTQALRLDQDVDLGGELGIALLRNRIEATRQESEKKDTSIDAAKVESCRLERENFLKEIAVIESDIKRFNATKETHEEQLKAIRGERSTLDAKALKALLGPVCPVCSVPIDQALSEGCNLSHDSWDPARIGEEKQRLADRIEAHNEAISMISGLISNQTPHLEGLRRKEGDIAKEIRNLERKIDEAKEQRQKRRLVAGQFVEKVSMLELASGNSAKAKEALEGLADQDNKLATAEAQLRGRHSVALSRMKDLFSYVCRRLLGNQVKASLVLSGQGIQADVEVGGMAMESLKAIAFDLTALLMSIEGHSVLPAFLVHDSPREADLGEAIYHRLFRLVRSFEDLADAPSFQYIITTTSRPPDELRESPYLIAELQGSKAQERLLRQNLGGLDA